MFKVNKEVEVFEYDELTETRQMVAFNEAVEMASYIVNGGEVVEVVEELMREKYGNGVYLKHDGRESYKVVGTFKLTDETAIAEASKYGVELEVEVVYADRMLYCPMGEISIDELENGFDGGLYIGAVEAENFVEGLHEGIYVIQSMSDNGVELAEEASYEAGRLVDSMFEEWVEQMAENDVRDWYYTANGGRYDLIEDFDLEGVK